MVPMTHLDESGAARMVDVADKKASQRQAIAEALLSFRQETYDAMMAGQLKKGDVFSVARIAGIQSAKKCSELIPLCHPLMLSSVSIDFETSETTASVRILATCRVIGQTGVEMEALTAAAIAALTIYDMTKALEKGVVIGPIRLLEKSGGKSDFVSNAASGQLIAEGRGAGER